ncbi:hypothetical protein [Spirochaeta isovalerica]|uniref:Uncharacterized protein n=1 Tax=Spirochaeta isovalerica TaxID=150 RepID=A0A841RB14_9SPIO|nr:hypothetical protein [Spirochaeta isovalerica]MBB6481145.1 hypothetical protein [Spirochaeta isovalerica]
MSNSPEIILLLVKLLAGFAATVTAVLLWSRTREASWLLVVVGTVFLYGEVIAETLQVFGLTDLQKFTFFGIPVIEALFALLPFLFFTAGFISFLTARRKRL